MSKPGNLLSIRGLGVAFNGGPPVLKDISLQLARGRVLAIVGESGSGKTLLARSIIGLLPPGAAIVGGSMDFQGQDIAALSAAASARLRGDGISMVFQEPQVSLNPVIRIGRQLTEAAIERGASEDAAWERALELLERVQIPGPSDAMRRFPHELSGGMCQRIMIAAALMLEPALLIADEPTTALDCAIQRDVLEIMLAAAKQDNAAVLLISHDLGLVAGYADDVLVLRDGRIVEQRPTSELLASPQAAYTRELLEAGTVMRTGRPPVSSAEFALEVRNVSVDYAVRRDWLWQQRRYKKALDDVTLEVRHGETLALVGESGSGKTSLARAILGLVGVSTGAIRVGGKDVAEGESAGRRFAQLIFQNPYAALSPRKTIWQSVAEPLQVEGRHDTATIDRRTRRILEEVGLSGEFLQRRPHELSGGQRQRVSIARALVTRPGLVIADEPGSALDVTIQAQILRLFASLQESYGFGCLFITHDLGVVEEVADRVVVLRQGRIVEHASTRDLFARPRHEYTRKLLAAMPVLQRDGSSGFRIINRQFIEVSP